MSKSSASIKLAGTAEQSNTRKVYLRARFFMDGIGNDFFPSSRFAFDNYGGVGGRDLLQDSENLPHLDIDPDDRQIGPLRLV